MGKKQKDKGGKYLLEEKVRKLVIAWSMAWEGHIGLYKTTRSRGHSLQYVPRISLDNTDKELLNRFFGLVGYGNVHLHRRFRDSATPSMKKDIYHWYICSLSQCKNFCEMVLPYLPAKARQAELIIKFADIRLRKLRNRKGIKYSKGENTWGFEEEEIYLELATLNKRGI